MRELLSRRQTHEGEINTLNKAFDAFMRSDNPAVATVRAAGERALAASAVAIQYLTSSQGDEMGTTYTEALNIVRRPAEMAAWLALGNIANEGESND